MRSQPHSQAAAGGTNHPTSPDPSSTQQLRDWLPGWLPGWLRDWVPDWMPRAVAVAAAAYLVYALSLRGQKLLDLLVQSVSQDNYIIGSTQQSYSTPK